MFYLIFEPESMFNSYVGMYGESALVRKISFEYLYQLHNRLIAFQNSVDACNCIGGTV